MSSRSNRDVYSPLISSPLNPEGHADLPKTPSPKSKRRSMYGNLSPTQRLLVRRAELAWSAPKEEMDQDGRESYVVVGEKPRHALDSDARGPSMAHVHKAHWAEDAESQDFFDELTSDDSVAEETGWRGRRWSTSVMDLRPTIGTGRSLLMAAGFMCLPVWAFITTGSLGGFWSLGEPVSLGPG